MAGHKPRSVTILCKFRVLLDYLSDEDVGQLFKALLEFGANGKRPDFADERTSLGLVFGAISNQIAHDTAKYEKKCRQNSENAKCKGKNAASKEETACNGKRPQANANDRLQSQTMENGTEAVQSGESSPKSKPVYVRSV
ncbi:MAG: hypothetical protein J1E40_05070 [Oscillospiraceae bacterium]|nr:hypothetical protein [Oscillospiraceae bacterium]